MICLLALSVAFGAPLPDIVTPLRTGNTAKSDAAVVIGIEDYAFLTEVPFARRDADAFYNFLRYSRGVPEDQIRLLGAGNREQIISALENAVAQVGTGGHLWVYFAGHGAAAPSDGERLLLGDDAKADSSTWTARSIRLSELRTKVRGTSAIIVLDTCFTGVGRGGEALTGERFAVPSWTTHAKDDAIIWAATSSNQSASPFKSAGHGLFTYFVTGALRGWADGEFDDTKDGIITLDEAQSYAARAMRAVQASQQPEVLGPKSTILIERVHEPPPDLSVLLQPAAVETPWKLEAGVEHVVQFSSEPEGAAVSVNGSYLCDTPCSKALAAGRHNVELSLERYDPVEKMLDIYEVTSVRESLVPRFGRLKVLTEPPGIVIRIGDETYKTPTPDIEIGFGGHEVRVEDPLWRPLSQQVEVGKGQEVVLELDPEPRIGGIKVVVRDPSDNDLPLEVSVDGRRVGRAPWTDEVQVGKHTIEAGDARKVVEIREAEVAQVELLVHRVDDRSGDILTIAGAAVGSAGVVAGSLAWAHGATPGSESSLATTQLVNSVGWSAAALGGVGLGIGVGYGYHTETLSRWSLFGSGLALGAGGIVLGVAGAMGQRADSQEEFARLQLLNTAGWSAAAAGVATSASSLLFSERGARDIQVTSVPGTIAIRGSW